MKILVVRPNENWILDRIAKEWSLCYPETVANSYHEADVIWLLSSWQWASIPREILSRKKVIATVHHVVPEKFTKDSLREFLARDQFVDEYHVPCQKTKDFISRMTKKTINVIGYWYNSEIWYPSSRDEARSSLGIENDRYVIGSFQRDTEGHDLKSPKLEKGPDLFVDYVKRIEKENVLVLLGGWRRQYVISRLNEHDIDYKYVEMAPLEQLRKMYAACDLYVVASRTEGGPQALMEASAMKIPIVSRDVGMARDVLADNCIIDIPNDLYYPLDKDIKSCYNKTNAYELKKKAEEYHKMFSKVLEK
jgi:glycosyltransferase involved in cell wall biosynthesis